MFFWGLEPNNSLVGQESPVLLRANEHIAWVRNQHNNLHHVYMYAQGTAATRRRQARMAHGLHHTILLSHQGMARMARPRQRRAKSCGGGLAGCRCNIDDTAVCFVNCSMLTRVLCVVFFLPQTRAIKKKSSHGLGSGATHDTAHQALCTHCTTRPGGVD